MVIVSIAVGAISFIGISTNAFVQGQGQLQQNITNIITNETRDIPQCSLAGQAFSYRSKVNSSRSFDRGNET
ncbi:MAG TPA: hypothetical protein VFG77_08265, partial [Nitrososphaeraceae archaeon]|nr:hypothetical protein [Nitrososphaeraceae archaeon]